MKARYVVRITPADVGKRVSVRQRLDPPDPSGASTTDTVGRLEAWNDGYLRIRTRRGELVAIPEELLIAARTIFDEVPRQTRR